MPDAETGGAVVVVPVLVLTAVLLEVLTVVELGVEVDVGGLLVLLAVVVVALVVVVRVVDAEPGWHCEYPERS